MRTVIEVREIPAGDVGAHWAAFTRVGVFGRGVDPIAEGDTLERLLEKLLQPWTHAQAQVYIVDQYLDDSTPDDIEARCLVCGHKLDYFSIPSMVGYGEDSSSSCPNCHSSQSDNPLTGQGSIIVNLHQFGLRDKTLHTTGS